MRQTKDRDQNTIESDLYNNKLHTRLKEEIEASRNSITFQTHL